MTSFLPHWTFSLQNSKSPFRKLDIKAPICSQLTKIMILEHPIVFVYLPSHDIDFEVEAASTSFHRNTVPSTTFDGIPSRTGTLYRVEEVEEGDMPSDTRVTDLMDHISSAANCINLPEDANVPSNTWAANDQLSGESHRAIAPNSPESGEAGFYFEQELRDAYSDLIGGMNPDDFLCLDGVYDDNVDLRESRWYEMEERRGDDAEETRAVELDEVRGDAFEIREGDDFGEKLAADLEEMQGIASKERRETDLDERGENSFLSGGLPFGEMELEEGEIPCFL